MELFFFFLKTEYFQAPKNIKKPTPKKSLIFQEMEFSSTKLKKNSYIFYIKNFLYFRKELTKPEKQKFRMFLSFLDMNLHT